MSLKEVSGFPSLVHSKKINYANKIQTSNGSTNAC